MECHFIKIGEVRKNKLFKRDKAMCQCCSKKLTLYSMTVGHRVSKAIAHSNDINNLQLECLSCNQDKSKLNKEYIKNARRFKKNGGGLNVFVNSVTYNRVKRDGSFCWFSENKFNLVEDDNVMIGDFAILERSVSHRS